LPATSGQFRGFASAVKNDDFEDDDDNSVTETKKRKKVKKEKKDGVKRSTHLTTTICDIGPKLQPFMGGATKMTRAEAMKEMFKYFKDVERNPLKKSEIKPDSKLQTLMDKPSDDYITMFGFLKHVHAHIKGPAKTKKK